MFSLKNVLLPWHKPGSHMQTITIQTSQNIDIEYDLAGVGDRIVAYIIDVLIYGAYLIVAGLVSKIFESKEGLCQFMYFLPVLLYQLLCELVLNGQSIGKKVKNIKVISLGDSNTLYLQATSVPEPGQTMAVLVVGGFLSGRVLRRRRTV
jgi:uncharacterized RDD family membrane protein YckC